MNCKVRYYGVAAVLVALAHGSAAQQVPPDEKAEAVKAELAATPPAKISHVVENSVVKIFTTVSYPDYYRPWTKQAPAELTATGVVIEGKRILSNAHAVLYASEVQIQANQAGDKISASVVAVAPGIDLAVLKLDDESFFDTHPALARATNLPEIKDVVMAYGYPKGGTSLSITKGIVSRIEFAPYNFGTAGMRIQIDAAINPGNSGGPAVADDKMIGLAFSHLANAENIGYIIPCEEIDLFLKAISHGHYEGKPMFADDLQTLENPALRDFLKLPKTVRGIVVHKPDADDPGDPLKKWDILTKIGKTPVDDQGMIEVNDNLRVFFTYMVQKVVSHGKIPLTIFRAGKEMEVELPVETKRPAVISGLDGAYPSYFLYGPICFSTATMEFVAGFGGASRQYLTDAGSALISRLGDKPAFPGESLVVVSSPFFPSKLGEGYSNPLGEVVKSVNGIPIRNLNHLVEVLRDTREKFIRFEFDQRTAETIVFPHDKIKAATEKIMDDNGLRSQGSADTMAVWTHHTKTTR